MSSTPPWPSSPTPPSTRSRLRKAEAMPAPALPDSHPGLAAAERLRRVSAARAAGEAPDREDARWLTGCVARYLKEAGAGLDMDAALGLTPTPGAVAWW